MRPILPPWIDSKLFIFTLVMLGVVVVVVGLGAAAIWLLRRTGLSKPHTARAKLEPRGLWIALICLTIASALVLPFRSSLLAEGPQALFGAWLAAYLGLIAVANRLLRDRVFHRALGRANRGDLDGALAVLRPAVARAVGPAPPNPEAAPDPGDPWTPPTVSIRRDARLAHRVNLMGVIQALKGDWAAALEWYRRAEAIGGSTPITRSNIGRARVQLGDAAEGFAAMREAQADAAGSPPLVRYQMATSFAMGLAEAGHHAEARARLDEAVAALKAARVWRPATRRKLAANFAKVRALLPPEPGLDAGGDRG